MKHKVSSGLVVVVIVLALSACGGEEASSTAADPSPTAETTAPSTPEVMTKAEAKGLIEPWFDKRDSTVEKLNQANTTNPDSITVFRKRAAALADATDELALGLAANDWPPETADDVDRLLDSLNQEYPIVAQLSESEDMDAYGDFFKKNLEPIATKVPGRMRTIEVALGIDSD